MAVSPMPHVPFLNFGCKNRLRNSNEPTTNEILNLDTAPIRVLLFVVERLRGKGRDSLMKNTLLTSQDLASKLFYEKESYEI
jgi:hypothetical protein